MKATAKKQKAKLPRRINLKLLGVILVAAVLLGTGVHLLHGFQVKRNASTFLRQAEQAEARLEEADKEGKPDRGLLGEALSNRGRYLDLVREAKAEERAKYGLLLERQARESQKANQIDSARRQLQQAYLVLSRVLIQDPGRDDVRRKQVDIGMDLGRFGDAREHLVTLLENAPGDGKLEYKGELEYKLGRCYEAEEDFAKAVDSYREAINHAPKLLDAYAHRARLLEEKLGDPQKATEAVDTMVANNNASAPAYLARARFVMRRAGVNAEGPVRDVTAFDRAEKDVQEALKLAPTDLEALLSAAQLAERGQRLDQARDYLRRAVKEHPKQLRPYLMLAQLEQRARRPDEAVAALRQGLQAQPEQPLLLLELAELLLEGGGTSEPKEIAGRLAKADTRAEFVNYVRGWAALNEGRRREAVEALEAARVPLSARPEDQKYAKFVNYNLGRAYQQLGETDRAYEAYVRAVSLDPTWLPARLGEGATLEARGRIDEALNVYRPLGKRLPEARLVTARLLLRRNLRLPEAQRNWQELEQILREVRQRDPGSAPAAVLAAEMLAARPDRRDDALDELLAARDRQPQKVELWTALADTSMRLGKPERALAVLDDAQAKLGDRVELRLARSRYWVRRGGPEARKALATLADNLKPFLPEQRRTLLAGLATAFLQTGDRQEAARLWAELAKEQPRNVTLKLALFDLALQADDEAALTRLLDEIKEVEGEGLNWTYGTVSYLLWKAGRGDKGQLGRARDLLKDLAARRSDWSKVPANQGRLEELDGNPEAAVRSYQRAVELGERDPAVLRRVVLLLHGQRRFAEADRLVRLLPDQAALSPELRRLAADVALRNQDPVRAYDLAREAVSPGSKDPRDLLWLGQVLAAVGSCAEAEPVLRRAVALDEQSPAAWAMLVRFLAPADRGRAEAALQEAEKKLPLGQAAAALALAQGHEALATPEHLERARQLYQGAVRAAPEDVPTLRAAANFFVQTGLASEGVPTLDKIIDQQAKHPKDAAWARQAKAVVLASRGDHRSKRAARVAIGLEGPDGLPLPPPANLSVEDKRARAVVLAAQVDVQHRTEAVRLLEELAGSGPAEAEDLFLLAKLHEQAGEWPKARERMLELLAGPGKGPRRANYLEHFVRSQLRRGETGPARISLERLQKLPEAADLLTTAELRARLDAAEGKAEQAVALLQGYTDNPKSKPEGRSTRLVRAAAVLDDLSRSRPADKQRFAATAEAMYRDYAAAEPKGALELASFFGRQGRIGEGLDWCEKAKNLAPAEVVCLTGQGILHGGRPTDEQIRRVEGWLDEVAAKYPPDTPTFQACRADLRDLQGKYAEAIALYRQILLRDKKNLVALNNLAWLLALQANPTAEALAEALDLINRAVDLEGPVPQLLDTRAVVYLTQGRPAEAIDDLEGAKSQRLLAPGSGTTMSLDFHRARAYRAANELQKARGALREADRQGLDLDRVHLLERNSYNQLRADLGV